MAQQGQYSISTVHHQTIQPYEYHPQNQYPQPPIQTPQSLSLPYPPHQYQYPPPHPHSHHQSITPAHPPPPPPHHHQYPPLPQYHHQPHPATYSQAQLQQAQFQAQAQLLAHAQSYTERPSAKRSREPLTDTGPGGETDDDPSPKRKKGQDVLFRIVVPSRQIGKVIGKEGHRIQKIREGTKATIKIADAITRYEERVIIISSKAYDDGVTSAEKALLQIADLILAEDSGPVEALRYAVGTTSSIGAAGGIGISASVGTVNGASSAHSGANYIKLLIAGTQAGGLIGISGQNIEKLRNSSGATITVLAPNQLPYCASAHESDRLVQISGEVPYVLRAVEEIGSQLRENPAKQVISISPTYNFSSTRVAQQYLDPTAAEYITLDILVPETMVGGLIGRCGSNISRIRNESGAMIKVFGGKGERKHRPIQLVGTTQQVALAKQRIDEYVYDQLVQQTGTQE